MEMTINSQLINKDIYFPYIPYESQIQFTEALFNLLKNKIKVGIFESPTGSGKSLCLLSSIFKFLDFIRYKNNKNGILDNEKDGIDQQKESGKEDDWLSEFGKNKVYSEHQIKLNSKKKFSERFPARNNIVYPNINLNKSDFSQDNAQLIDIDDNNLSSHKFDYKQNLNSNYLNIDSKITLKDEEEKTQVFYLTRTHTQIAQIVNEIKKISSHISKLSSKENFNFKVSVLGSRKNLCINRLVNQNSFSNEKINDMCMDLISGKSSSSKKCEFNNPILLESLVNENSNNIMDIEDLYKLGSDLKACPYFSSRMSLYVADIVILPYNSIIDVNVRKGLNLSLKNKILIFDEAHNLIDNILKCYSAQISFETLVIYFISLNRYIEKFSTRLRSNTLMLINQLNSFLFKIIRLFMKKFGHNYPEYENEHIIKNEYKLSELIIELDILNLNVFKIVNFINLSNLNEKLKWSFNSLLNEEIAKNLKGHEDEMLNKKNIKCNLRKKMDSIKDNMPYINDIFLTYSKGKFSVEMNRLNKLKLSSELYNKFFASDRFSEIPNILKSLTGQDEDGVFILEKTDEIEKSSNSDAYFYLIGDNKEAENRIGLFNNLKFFLNNPNRHFDKIIKESKAIVLAGGTMKPMDEFDILFSSLIEEKNEKSNKNKIIKFEGNSVTNKNNVMVTTLTFNPLEFKEVFKINKDSILKLNNSILSSMKQKNTTLTFNYENFKHNSNYLFKSILDILIFYKVVIFKNVYQAANFSNSCKSQNGAMNPFGIVAFVTSYEIIEKFKDFYLEMKKKLFNNSHKLNKKLTNDLESESNFSQEFYQLNFFDEIIFEEKSANNDAFSIYYENIKMKKKNSMLFAVIGGKLSEGINFSDELARCVILFGLPYPNIKSHEIKSKMEYYNYLFKLNKSAINGDEYYENLCIKAINQTIGRAIRHKDDFSKIVLVDSRFLNLRIRNKLPKWLVQSEMIEFTSLNCFENHVERIIDFFNVQKTVEN